MNNISRRLSSMEVVVEEEEEEEVVVVAVTIIIHNTVGYYLVVNWILFLVNRNRCTVLTFSDLLISCSNL
jgi:hypothetical protein